MSMWSLDLGFMELEATRWFNRVKTHFLCWHVKSFWNKLLFSENSVVSRLTRFETLLWN